LLLSDESNSKKLISQRSATIVPRLGKVNKNQVIHQQMYIITTIYALASIKTSTKLCRST